MCSSEAALLVIRLTSLTPGDSGERGRVGLHICYWDNLRPPHHERTPADRSRAGTVGPRLSPAPIVHVTLALARVQSLPRRALDRQELARFGPTTPTHPRGLLLFDRRLDRLWCCRTLLL